MQRQHECWACLGNARDWRFDHTDHEIAQLKRLRFAKRSEQLNPERESGNWFSYARCDRRTHKPAIGPYEARRNLRQSLVVFGN